MEGVANIIYVCRYESIMANAVSPNAIVDDTTEFGHVILDRYVYGLTGLNVYKLLTAGRPVLVNISRYVAGCQYGHIANEITNWKISDLTCSGLDHWDCDPIEAGLFMEFDPIEESRVGEKKLLSSAGQDLMTL